MPWASILGAVGGKLIGGLIEGGTSAAAAGAQVSGANAATEEQRRQYDITRADNLPFYNTGVAANQRLAYLLGLTPAGGGPNATIGGTGTAGTGLTAEQLRTQLAPQFTTQNPGSLADFPAGGIPQSRDAYPIYLKDGTVITTPREYEEARIRAVAGTSTVDQAGLDAAVQAALARQGSGGTAGTGGDGSVPGGDYGFLLRRFGLSDLNADPVYQSGLKFGLDEGTGAINARAIAGGGYDSGATIKALTRFANDYGSTKANESYNRYTNDQNNIFNRLSGVSGTGQVATNQIGAAGRNMANQVSDFQTQAGNARSAGIVGVGNAIGGIWNGYRAPGTSPSYNEFVGNAYTSGFGPAFTQENIYG